MYYLIFIYTCETYVHEFNTEEDALKDYESYKHVSENICKIILSKGIQLNKEV
ncbi:hypothetical protein [Tissierella creatinophila]|uniref:Uncharacterized protein n=1 Tax=Tissierella creatinophila DSM 6911 TaxID=1123403 RepID=A0A1U7M4V6_TISCR|nr:hypothetical protein [Tissierella creatinophila]OLS02249.1 hypothetical protein TICRE_17800 [Tissierella creatinophila DSM 6911]